MEYISEFYNSSIKDNNEILKDLGGKKHIEDNLTYIDNFRVFLSGNKYLKPLIDNDNSIKEEFDKIEKAQERIKKKPEEISTQTSAPIQAPREISTQTSAPIQAPRPVNLTRNRLNTFIETQNKLMDNATEYLDQCKLNISNLKGGSRKVSKNTSVKKGISKRFQRTRKL